MYLTAFFYFIHYLYDPLLAFMYDVTICALRGQSE